jgi:hypothetical protein
LNVKRIQQGTDLDGVAIEKIAKTVAMKINLIAICDV